MNTIDLETLSHEVELIKERNARVDADKAWEVSWARRLLIFAFTYIVVVIFFFSMKLPNPFVNAFVPAEGFIISTFTLGLIKKWWLRRRAAAGK